MPPPVKRSLDAFIAAIHDSHGIKSNIAARLGVDRITVERYLKRWPKAQEIYRQEVEAVGDIAESVIIKNLRAEDIETARWYARMKLKDRGYVDRSESRVSGSVETVIRELVIERPKSASSDRDTITLD
jgi:hypothetical protein